MNIKNNDLNKAIIKVNELINNKLKDIIKFINEIPNDYNNLLIMSSVRKEYYIKTIELRVDEILKPRYLKIINESK